MEAAGIEDASKLREDWHQQDRTYPCRKHMMEHEGEEESGEMFSPNGSGQYTTREDAVSFTVQGLRNALTAAESMVTEPPCPMDEYIIQL